MADFKNAQRIRIFDPLADSGNGEDKAFADDKPLYFSIVDAALGAGKRDLNLVVINDAYGAAPTTIPVAGKYEVIPTAYDDGDAVPLLTDENGRLLIALGEASAIYVDDTAFTVEEDKIMAIGALADEDTTDSVTEGNIGIPRMTLNRRLIIADNFLDDGAFGLGTDYVSAIGGVYDADGSDTLDDNDIGIPRVSQKRKLLVQVSKDDNANSETNPIYTYAVASASSQEIHEYDTAVVNKNATDSTNFKYEVPAASSDRFLLKSIIVAASGVLKCEVQVGPTATLVSKAVIFTTGAKLTEQVFFDPPIEVKEAGGGEKVLLVVTNEDNQNMSIYTTIIGSLLPE